MMKGLITFLCICNSVFGSMHWTSPVLAWSNMNYFAGQNLQVNDVVDTNLFNKGSRYIRADKNPEVIFIFAEPELRTEQLSVLTQSHSVNPDGGALGNLKALMESFSTSSLSIPYISAENGQIAPAIVNNMVSRYGTTPIYVNYEAGRTKMLEDITSGNWNVLNNGVTEIIHVAFDSPAVREDGATVLGNYKADDEYIMKVHNALKSHNVQYAAAFTSEKTGFTQEHLNARREVSRATATFAAVKEGGSIYWPSIINEVILLMAPLILILVIGICCTAQIQSSYKFETPERKKQ